MSTLKAPPCAMARLLAGVLVFASGAAAQSQQSFDGVWLHASGGLNLLKLEIRTHEKSTEAIFTHPKEMTISQDGTITGSTLDFVSEQPETVSVESATLTFANGPVMRQTDDSNATLSFAPQIKPLAFVRVRPGEPAVMGGK